MKTSFRMARWLTLGLAAVAVSVPCRPLGAAFVRYQNFETYTNGATYTDASGGTLIVTNDNGNLVGAKAITANNQGLFLDIPTIADGTTGTVYFRSKWSAASGGFGHYLMTAASAPDFYSYYWGRGPIRSGTTISILAASGGGTVTTPGWTTVPAGVWTRWWIYADNAANTYEVWVQDETGGARTKVYTAAAPSGVFGALSTADIKALGFFNTAGAASTTWYLDDIYVDIAGLNLSDPTPPTAPSLPSPTNTATGVSANPTLTWSSTNATGYNAFLWPTGGATNTTNVTSASWIPGTLANATEYNWQVVATNASGATTGDVWTFTTVAAVPPSAPSAISPADTATGVGVNPTLSWSCSGADGYQASLWATGGATNTTNVTSASWTPGKLGYYSNYNWQIVATNLYGSATGGVWTFATTSGGGGGASYRLKISFPNYSRAETLTNFPALVVLSNGMAGTGFDFGTFLSTNGYDLRFWNETATTNLNYEIESWSTGASSYVWVQIANFTSNSYVWATWGDAANSNQPAYATNGATWSAGYKGVWHLGESVTDEQTTGRYAEASGSGNYGLQNNCSVGTGIVGRCGYFDGNNDYIAIQMATPSTYDIGDLLTASVWFKSLPSGWSPSANGWDTMFQKGHDWNWCIRRNGGTDGITFNTRGNEGGGNISPSPSDGNWHNFTATYRAAPASLILYYDGALYYTDPTPVTTLIDQPNNNTLRIGANEGGGEAFQGLLDEARVSQAYRSANWVWAEYMNVASNSFFNTLGTVQPPGNIRNNAATNVVNNAADLVATLNATSAFYQVWAYWGTVDGTNNGAGLWQNTNSLGSFTDQNLVLTNHVTGLLSNTLYYYTFRATNDSTNFWASPSASFTTRGPPAALSVIAPTNTATGVGINSTLSWSPNGADGYQASLWPDGGATNTTNVTSASWTPGTLGYSSNYNWQIVATNSYGSVTGSVWTFTTRSGVPDAPGYVSPANGAVNADPNGMLVWSNTYLATGYDVRLWLSSDSRPAIPNASVAGTSWNITPTLQPGSQYSWEIAAGNSYGATTGATWTFTTWTPGTFVWNGSVDNLWTTPGNWTNNSSYPQYIYDTAIFTGAVQTAVNLNGDKTVGNIVFSNATAAFSLTNSTLTLKDGGTIAVQGASAAVNHTLSSALSLQGALVVTNAKAGTTLLLNGAITGSGTLTLAGPGKTYLGANNSGFSGAIVINSCDVQNGDGYAFGATGTPTTFNGGGWAPMINGTTPEPFNIAGNATFNSWGGYPVASGAIAISNGVTLTVNTGNGNFAGLSGALSGGGGLNIVGRGDLSWEGNEAWLLGTAANTYGGTTTVRQGCLQLMKTAGLDAVPGDLVVGIGTAPALVRLDNSDQIKDSATVTLYSHAANYGILKMNGKSDTIGGLLSSGTGGAFVQNGDAAAVSTLTVSNAADCAFGGVFRDGKAAALNVVKAGSGAFFVNSPASADPWTGTFTVNGGTLGGTGIIACAVTVNAGALAPGSGGAGTLTITDNLTLTSSSTLAFEIGQPGLPGSDLIDGVNNLVLAGTLNVTALPELGAVPRGKVWTLIKYRGTLTNHGLTLGTHPPGLQVDTSRPGQVNLVSPPSGVMIIIR